MNIEKILAEKGKLIDKEIRSVFPKSVQNLHDAVYYHLGTGGKRIRPVLAIAVCEALGGDVKKVIPFAAACEVLHQWLLIHDDIEDGDRIRREKEAVWVKYGLAHGINIGDYMSAKVYELILNSKNYGVGNETVFRLLNATVKTAVKTAEGQAMDMNLRKSNNPSEKDYMDMVVGKTGHYLAIPMVGGAIVAGADEKVIGTIREFGPCIGPAFQITDDILDLTAGKGRKEIGRDIKEGKRSMLVVHCLSKCNKKEKKSLLRILNKPADKTTNADVLLVKKLFGKYGSIEYAQDKAKELINKSKEITKDLPPKLRSILDEFADYMVERKR
ncbi:MAG: polyprenyl synthetase family protein [Candidatus Aenigmarchaeota archaeon]|nr:polyprenyl synthetase family protein [Candidatus Aenigmarchaeota archaeon]